MPVVAEPEERREQPGTPRGALLSVSCNVVGAEVVLDGNVLGTAPLTDVEIPPTPQTLVVRREGHEDFLRAIIPRAGERLTLEAVLKPKAGEYAAGRTFFKLLAGVHGVAHVEHTGEYRELGGTLDAAATQTMEGTRLGAALQFGSMTNPYFGMGAILGFWFADSDYGLAVSRTAEFSPFLELRLPIRAAGRELVELYANAGGGLSVRFLHDDVVEALELARTKTDPFGIGWNVVTALGGQVNVTRTLGLFVEAGWQMRRFTHTLNRYGGEGVRDGSRDVGWNELALGVGLAHLH